GHRRHFGAADDADQPRSEYQVDQGFRGERQDRGAHRQGLDAGDRAADRGRRSLRRRPVVEARSQHRATRSSRRLCGDDQYAARGAQSFRDPAIHVPRTEERPRRPCGAVVARRDGWPAQPGAVLHDNQIRRRQSEDRAGGARRHQGGARPDPQRHQDGGRNLQGVHRRQDQRRGSPGVAQGARHDGMEPAAAGHHEIRRPSVQGRHAEDHAQSLHRLLPAGRARPEGQLIDMAALLDVSDVTLRYKTSSAVVTATERVSFTVDRSDRFVLLGPSGCGKSTLLKAVGGYMTPSEGKMRISGREISEPGADRMMIFQEFDQLLPWKTVLENVMFPLLMTRRLPRKEAEGRARAYLEKVSLTRVVDAYPHTLSGGMKQRVAIARGMAMEPDILLMDEPFAALDALTRRTCQDELLQLWAETKFTVLFVTHSIAEAIKIGNRILLLSPHPGRVKAEV